MSNGAVDEKATIDPPPMEASRIGFGMIALIVVLLFVISEV